MSTIAPKPDWAPSIWRDSRGNMFAQFGQDVLRFEYTNGGLDKLLKLIPAIEGQPGYVSGGQNIADHTLRKPVKVNRNTERNRIISKGLKARPERRQLLQDMIRKAGIKESK